MPLSMQLVLCFRVLSRKGFVNDTGMHGLQNISPGPWLLSESCHEKRNIGQYRKVIVVPHLSETEPLHLGLWIHADCQARHFTDTSNDIGL